MDVWFLEEQDLSLRLGYCLTPEVDRGSFRRSAHNANEVFLPCLDGLLFQVATVIIWWNNMEFIVVCPDFFPVCRRYPIFEDLVYWKNSLVFDSGQCPVSVQDHFSLCIVIYGFNTGGVSINFV